MSSTLSVTVIVGNGFDLAAGLRTRTTDFMDAFSNKHGDDEGPVGSLARQIKKEGPETWADFEKKLGEYAATIDETEGDGAADAALDCKDAIDFDLAEFIAGEDSRITDDFVNANADAVMGSIALWYSALQPLERQSIARSYFANYTTDVSVVTLNYTSLLPRLFLAFGTNGHVAPVGSEQITSIRFIRLVQAHGSLEKEPICGVNDVSQIRSDALASNEAVAKNYVKGKMQELFGSDQAHKATNAIQSSDIVIIYGLSLGETDARWWEEVVKLLRRDSDRYVILASTEAASSRSTSVRYYRFSQTLKGRLLTRGGASDEELAELMERVFIIPAEAIFTFKVTLKSDNIAVL